MNVRSIRRVIRVSTSRDHTREVICSAIRQLRPIEFFYHGGYRTVEPFALGIVLNDRRDNESLLCYQTGGVSDLLEVEGWKLYRVSDIEDIEVLKEHFTGDRPGFVPQNLEMVRIISCVQPVPHPEEKAVPPPQPEIKVETAPLPPPMPEPKPQPVIRYLTHNELMERFRYAHPQPIPDLYAMLWPEPLEKPFPESPKTKNRPENGILDSAANYLLGQTA